MCIPFERTRRRQHSLGPMRLVRPLVPYGLRWLWLQQSELSGTSIPLWHVLRWTQMGPSLNTIWELQRLRTFSFYDSISLLSVDENEHTLRLQYVRATFAGVGRLYSKSRQAYHFTAEFFYSFLFFFSINCNGKHQWYRANKTLCDTGS